MAALIPVSSLTDQDFGRVREMAYTACGISFHPGKRALVSSRLERLVRLHGFTSFSSYLNFLAERINREEFIEFIDTLTTNHSGFWREPEHFRFLQKTILAGKTPRLRIWSAACATGEEPYTVGMCAIDAGRPNCSITATDISRRALNSASRGIYETPKLSGLPPGWQVRYFQQEGDGTAMRVVAAVRALVNFAPLNLLQPFQHLGTFDVILCRNVMIYFDQQTRDGLITRLAAQLSAGGYLFTGHSETLLRVPGELEYVQPAVYRRC